MAQHFLLSAKARTLSVVQVARMTEDQARETFRALRWASTGGEPVCPRCGCLAVYEYASRPIFKCKACHHQFSVTSGTIFASRKLSFTGDAPPAGRQTPSPPMPKQLSGLRSGVETVAMDGAGYVPRRRTESPKLEPLA